MREKCRKVLWESQRETKSKREGKRERDYERKRQIMTISERKVDRAYERELGKRDYQREICRYRL